MSQPGRAASQWLPAATWETGGLRGWRRKSQPVRRVRHRVLGFVGAHGRWCGRGGKGPAELLHSCAVQACRKSSQKATSVYYGLSRTRVGEVRASAVLVAGHFGIDGPRDEPADRDIGLLRDGHQTLVEVLRDAVAQLAPARAACRWRPCRTARRYPAKGRRREVDALAVTPRSQPPSDLRIKAEPSRPTSGCSGVHDLGRGRTFRRHREPARPRVSENLPEIIR